MTFKLVTCYRRPKYPKINVATKSSVKKKSSGKKRKKSTSHRHRSKSSYVSSSLFSKNFYPANYFFQDDPRNRFVDTRVGVNDQNGFLITRNTPHLAPQRHVLPSSRALSQHYLSKVGWHLANHQNIFIWSPSTSIIDVGDGDLLDGFYLEITRRCWRLTFTKFTKECL